MTTPEDDGDMKPTSNGGMKSPENMEKFQKIIENYSKAVEADNPEDAQAAAMEALMFAAAEAEANPSPHLIQMEEAANCEAKGDWAGAEAAHKRVIEMQRASGPEGAVMKAQMDLSRFYVLLGRLDEAWNYACAVWHRCSAFHGPGKSGILRASKE
jgi:tetratricopeptide (TPR) repeat protein